MSRAGQVRLAAFAVWLGLLAVMVWVIQRRIVPVTGMALQSQVMGYSYDDVTAFGVALSRSEVAGLYRNVLLGLDSLFIAVFALWLVLSFRGRLWAGVLIAVLYAAADLGENLLLARELSWTWGVQSQSFGWVLYPGVNGGHPVAVLFTQAKLVLFAGVVTVIGIRDLMRWRRG